jgi:hypothetical protein
MKLRFFVKSATYRNKINKLTNVYFFTGMATISGLIQIYEKAIEDF